MVGWIGLAVQYYVSHNNPNLAGLSGVGFLFKFLSYFTVLSNIIVAVSFTSGLIAPQSAIGKFFSRPSVQTAIAVYIGIVGLIYSLVLRRLWAPEGLAKFADATLHDVIPILYLLYWFIFVPKRALNWKNPFWWLIYPFFYIIYTLIRGAVMNDYPYPFVDVNQIGYPAALLTTVILFMGFFVAGEIFVGIDKLMGRTANDRAT